MNKIAICFYGQPRKYKQILYKWQKLINDLNADVFIHTWYGIDRGKSEINLNELINDLKPKEIKVSNQHKFTSLIPPDSKYENQGYHAMQQAYSITNCFRAMDDYSILMQTQYDVCIRCRMDIDLHNIDTISNFIKEKSFREDTNLYVAGNHWKEHIEFDDNIMLGNAETMKNLAIDYFSYTIHYINNTKIIPCGEQNLFRWFIENNKLNSIVKSNILNFDLLVYSKDESIILNQNE